MKRTILFFFIIFTVLNVSAQTKNQLSPTVRENNPMTELSKRSQRNRVLATPKLPKQISNIQTEDSLILSDYVMTIERIDDKLNSIQDSAQLGSESGHFGSVLDNISKNVSLIRQNNRSRRSAVNLKSVYLYQSFATSLEKENKDIRDRINVLYDRTYRANLSMRTLYKDSAFHSLFENKNLTLFLNRKLIRLERKYTLTDSTLKANTDTINVLKVKAADNSINLSGMLGRMDRKLDKARPQLFGHEERCLWHRDDTEVIANDSVPKVRNILAGEGKAVGYYMSQKSGNKVFVLILCALLFIWLFLKRKLLKTIKNEKKEYDFLHLQYLNNHPVLSLFVVLLSLMPFFDAYSPTSYISVVYFLLLAASTFITLKKEDQTFRFYWLALLVLFVMNTVTYLTIEPTFLSRLWMMGIHLAIIFFAFLFYNKLSKQRPYYKWIRAAMLIGILLSAFAVLCNLFGRFSLSGLLGLASIFAITQALILPIFIDTILEILLLQLLSSRLRKGVNQTFDCNIVIRKIKLPLLLMAVLLWIIMLSSNLNIYHDLSASVVNTLTLTRTFGSISFKLVNVLWFFVIIWSAHILEKLVSFLFGETGSELEDTTTMTKGEHSRLLVLRLLVIIGGYLLAIAASGLPIDKLTFLLGALGVGIGMGLQNVVNNFVSGIILIFDGSLQIGDNIEVSGQAGKVKEIGMRASTLSTIDGAEVIIPNGTILSQNIVNWTYSNDQKRVTLAFSLYGKELDANVINEVINSTVKDIPNILTKRNPVILYTKVTGLGSTLTVSFWSSIKNVDQVKSEALLRLHAAFSDKNIGFNSVTQI